MLNRRKKTTKFRGHHTHGYGSKKKHRGSGHQGGVGMAGTGKKADQKRPNIWKDTKYFGRHGFISKNVPHMKSVNIFYIEEHFDSLLAKGKIKKSGDSYALDLHDLKANKLLGSGKATRKYAIKCDFATAGAKEKIEGAGGTLALKEKKVHAPKAKAEKKARKKDASEETEE